MKLTAQQAMGMAWAITQYGEDVMIQQQGHWLTLDFFTREIVMCVWDRTGSVYETESLGGGVNNAVKDDPVFTPGEYQKVTLPNSRLLAMMNKIADERDHYRREVEKLNPSALLREDMARALARGVR